MSYDDRLAKVEKENDDLLRENQRMRMALQKIHGHALRASSRTVLHRRREIDADKVALIAGEALKRTN